MSPAWSTPLGFCNRHESSSSSSLSFLSAAASGREAKPLHKKALDGHKGASASLKSTIRAERTELDASLASAARSEAEMSKAVPLRVRSAKAAGLQVQCGMHGSSGALPAAPHTCASQGNPEDQACAPQLGCRCMLAGMLINVACRLCWL